MREQEWVINWNQLEFFPETIIKQFSLFQEKLIAEIYSALKLAGNEKKYREHPGLLQADKKYIAPFSDEAAFFKQVFTQDKVTDIFNAKVVDKLALNAFWIISLYSIISISSDTDNLLLKTIIAPSQISLTSSTIIYTLQFMTYYFLLLRNFANALGMLELNQHYATLKDTYASKNMIEMPKGDVREIIHYGVQFGSLWVIRQLPLIFLPSGALLQTVQAGVNLLTALVNMQFIGQLILSYPLFSLGLRQRDVRLKLREQPELCFAFGAVYQLCSYGLVFGLGNLLPLMISQMPHLPVIALVSFPAYLVGIVLSRLAIIVNGMLLTHFLLAAYHVKFPTKASISVDITTNNFLKDFKHFFCGIMLAPDYLTSFLTEYLTDSVVLYAKDKLKKEGVDIFTMFIALVSEKKRPEDNEVDMLGYFAEKLDVENFFKGNNNQSYLDHLKEKLSTFLNVIFSVKNFTGSVAECYALLSFFYRVFKTQEQNNSNPPVVQIEKLSKINAVLLPHAKLSFQKILLAGNYLSNTRSFLFVQERMSDFFRMMYLLQCYQIQLQKKYLLPKMITQFDEFYADPVIRPNLVGGLECIYNISNKLISFRENSAYFVHLTIQIDKFFSRKDITIACMFAPFSLSFVRTLLTIEGVLWSGNLLIKCLEELFLFFKSKGISSVLGFDEWSENVTKLSKRVDEIQKIKNSLPPSFLEHLFVFLKKQNADTCFLNLRKSSIYLLHSLDPARRNDYKKIEDEFDLLDSVVQTFGFPASCRGEKPMQDSDSAFETKALSDEEVARRFPSSHHFFQTAPSLPSAPAASADENSDFSEAEEESYRIVGSKCSFKRGS